jgi:hypothetical protein
MRTLETFVALRIANVLDIHPDGSLMGVSETFRVAEPSAAIEFVAT